MDSDAELREFFELVWSGRWTIAVVLSVTLALGIFYSVIASPTYEADGLVQVEENDKKGGLMGSSDISSLLLGSPVETEAEIQILQSRMVLNDVIDRMNLLVTAYPRLLPVIGGGVARWNRRRSEPVDVPFLRSFAWGGEKIDVPTLDVPDAMLGRRLKLTATSTGYSLEGPDGNKLGEGVVGQPLNVNAPEGAITLFVRALRARPGTQFNLVRSSRIDVLADLMGRLRISEQGKQSGVIGITFKGQSPEFVTQVVDYIEDTYLRQNVERRSAEAKQSLEFLQDQLPELKAKLDEAQARLNAYQVQRGSVDVTSETQLILQQGVDLESQRLQLQQQRQQALQRFTDKHPFIVALDQQIGAIEKAQGELQGKSQKLPKTQQEILGLLRDVDANSVLYSQMLNSMQELQVAKAGTIGNVRIIDHAIKPQHPSWPKLGLILPLSLILGLFFGTGLVFGRRALLRGVDDPTELERKTGLAIYATIPYAREQRRMGMAIARNEPGSHILALRDGGNPAVEALRSLRTSLHFAMLESSSNTVMLTGPTPNIGKSFLTVNFGAVLALSGKKVVAVDADLRRGRMHQYITTSAAPGVTEYVVGDADLESIIRKTGVDGFDMITHGTIPPNPAELLLHERFAGLLSQLSARYDYVLIDSPPVLPVSDPAIIGRLVGCSLLVLKSAEHPMREIEEVLRRLSSSGVQIRGLLFNQVGARAGSYGYGGYKYTEYRYDS